MATFATSQQWLHQSALLLEARPQTTKITCRYSVKPKPARRRTKTSKAVDDNGDVALPDAPPAATKPGKSAAAAAAATTGTTAAPRATLVLKAVDPASGVCLKYKTTKAAEVSRLVQLLGQLSQRQAGLVAAAAAATADESEEAETPAAATSAVPSPAPAAAQLSQQPQQQQSGGGGGGGGKGKKKKGKR